MGLLGLSQLYCLAMEIRVPITIVKQGLSVGFVRWNGHQILGAISLTDASFNTLKIWDLKTSELWKSVHS